MEKYCDIYTKYPSAAGYISFSETDFKSPVIAEKNYDLPYAEKNDSASEQFNYVVHLNNTKIESYYNSARAYNDNASGFIEYSDLMNDYTFKVVGAFYVNTNAKDDNGYIFPYNVTEQLTEKSYSTFFDRLNARFLDSTGVTLTRQDKLLTVSCPTRFRENFRFVIVGVLRDSSGQKPVATQNSKVHYPQVVYDDRGEENPYRLVSHWYPEIVYKDRHNQVLTRKASLEDYIQ